MKVIIVKKWAFLLLDVPWTKEHLLLNEHLRESSRGRITGKIYIWSRCESSDKKQHMISMFWVFSGRFHA